MENIQYITKELLDKGYRKQRLNNLLLLEKVKINKSVNENNRNIFIKNITTRIENLNKKIF